MLSLSGRWASPLKGPHPAAADPSNLMKEVMGISVRPEEGTSGQRKGVFTYSRLKETYKAALIEACMYYFLNFKEATGYKLCSSYSNYEYAISTILKCPTVYL